MKQHFGYIVLIVNLGLVISELEKIEVAVRAKMIYILSDAYGPFWFEDGGLFKNPAKHAESLVKIGHEYGRSDEEFIKSFRDKYSNPLPPSWMTLEITSFGTLSMLFSQLKPGRSKRNIANYFGVSDQIFGTWLLIALSILETFAHTIQDYGTGL